MGGRLIVVVSEGAAGEATERRPREGENLEETVTIRDHPRTVRLYYASGCTRRDGTQLGRAVALGQRRDRQGAETD